MRCALGLMHQIHAECGLSEGCGYTRSICMYHMHDSFGKRTELLMHDLAGAATGALQMSSGILDALDGMDAKMAGKIPLYILSQEALQASNVCAVLARVRPRNAFLAEGLLLRSCSACPIGYDLLLSCSTSTGLQ